MSSTPGTITKIGKYDIIDVLGQGGMGVVYKATDSRIGRLVAIKMMTGAFTEDPDLLKRFYREAQSTGMLQHPNIVIVYDLGDENGTPYLVMEYLEGEPLDKVMASVRRFSLPEKLGIVIQVCNALKYAHQRGVVHRDIKPANVMVLKDGDVKLVDFGIARIANNTITQTGQVVGTIYYMSPEQINGQVVDGRSDIFSTGVMFYQLLTGRLPFQGVDTASTLFKIINDPPPPLKTYLNDDYPAELEEILLRAMAKDREERYAGAEDLAFDLSRIQEAIRRNMSEEYVTQAQNAIQQSQLNKAKELLQQVLRADSQHAIAKDLIHQVQRRIQQQQREEKVLQLRTSADEALRSESFDEALAYVTQALEVEKTSPDLLKLRTEIQEAKKRKQRLDTLLREAGSALDISDFEAAHNLLQDALTTAPDNPQARSMLAAATKGLAESQRQKQFRTLLAEAQKNIAGRQFAKALELLKQAEGIDPTSPELRALMSLATSAQQQEARRKELEECLAEIERSLAQEDYRVAAEQAEAALQKFSNDPGLVRLKILADKQHDAAEKKRFVEEQMAAARELLDLGKAPEAHTLLQQALQKAPGNPRLQTLLGVVRESADREKQEQMKAGYIRQAREAIQKKDYEAAIGILETAQEEFEDASEIHDLLQFAREEEASFVQRKNIEAVTREAQQFMAEEEYERAISMLQSVLEETASDELRGLLNEARQSLEEFNRQIEVVVAKAERLLNARKVEETVSLLESQPQSYGRSLVFRKILEQSRQEQAQLQTIRKTIASAQAVQEKGNFAAALEMLGACRHSYGDIPEIIQALKEVESKRAAAARSALEKAVRDCRVLLLSRQYDATLKLLQSVQAFAPSAPQELRDQCESLKKEATSALERQKRDAQLNSAISASSQTAAETMIAGSYEATQTLGTVALGSAERAAVKPVPAAPLRPRPTPARSSGKRIWLIFAMALVMIVGAGIYFKYGISRPIAPAVTATTYVEVQGIPWGTVKSIMSKDGKTVAEVNQQTPIRIPLSPGEYTIAMEGPNGEEKTKQITVSDQSPGSYTEIFEQIEVEKIVNAN